MIVGVAGVFFGVLIGWIVGSQQAAGPRPAAAPAAAQTAPAPQTAQFDEARAGSLRDAAARDPRDARSRVELANLYFDADRFQDAVRWYEDALKIDPRNVNASTDLGISYYYLNQADRALQQFDRSLAIDPKHSKTLLNIGIVLAFGKEDLAGAAKAFQRVLDVAPDSPDGRAARQALESLRNAHPNLTGPEPAAGKPPG
jgi:tetratricopeptide (TPR) repeat protein